MKCSAKYTARRRQNLSARPNRITPSTPCQTRPKKSRRFEAITEPSTIQIALFFALLSQVSLSQPLFSVDPGGVSSNHALSQTPLGCSRCPGHHAGPRTNRHHSWPIKCTLRTFWSELHRRQCWAGLVGWRIPLSRCLFSFWQAVVPFRVDLP